jgi:hypothetical protein
VLFAILAFSSTGEAATKRTVHHRSRHSSRVFTGSSTKKKKVTRPTRPPQKTTAAAKHKTAATKPQ